MLSPLRPKPGSQPRRSPPPSLLSLPAASPAAVPRSRGLPPPPLSALRLQPQPRQHGCSAASALLLLVLLFLLRARLGQANRGGDRRFAELKRCSDEECSMLMYRGRALQDFTGPDCRFVNFKEGEAVYVYYKLVGVSPELWAGSVGSVFGYFPKDLIEVNHQYSEQELELPTDETDFVCFDGGTDNFDNYDVEDLLGFLGETVKDEEEDELNPSRTESSEKPLEEVEEENPKNVNVEEPFEVSKDGSDEPETELDSKVLANSEENSLPSENTKNLEEEFETQRPPIHVNSHADNSQGNQPSLEPLEEMLQDKLKVPESENAKNINISQLSKDWEEIDAYKLLKKEINLDLKTKFGSTADALISDDETTRLVTSLEDEFDEELGTDDSKVEEEDKDSFDEPPLLTFTNGEDRKTSGKTVIDKYSTEGDTDEIAQPKTDEKSDKNILKTLGDTIFSIVGGGEEERDAADLDGSDLDEEKVEDNEKILPSKWEEDGSPLTIEVPVINHDKNLEDTLEIGTETEIKGKSERLQSSKEEFMKNGMELGNEDISVKSPTHEIGLKLNNPAEIREDTLKSPPNDMEGDLKGTIIHQIIKGELHEEKSGEKVLNNNLESDPIHKNLWKKMKEKNTEQKSVNIKPPLEDEQQNASKGNVDTTGLSEDEQEQEMFPVKMQGKESTQPPVLKIQNQVIISSVDQTDLPREKVEDKLMLEENLLGHQEKDKESEINKQLDEKIRHSEREIRDQLSKDGSKETESTQNKDKDIPQDDKTNYFQENVGQPHITETTELQTENSEAEDDDFHTEEDLLEDENAKSATASGQSSRINVDVQMKEKATSGVNKIINTMQDTKEKTSMFLDTEGQDSSLQGSVETMPKGITANVGESVKKAIGQQEKNPLEKDKNPTSSAISGSLGKNENQAQDLVEETNYFEKEDFLNNKKSFSYTDDFSQEDLEYSQNSTETESQINQQSDSTELEDNLIYKKSVMSEYSDTVKQLPIIKGFLDEKRVERLEKYLGSENVLQMESTFHDMESKLKLAQKESLAYNMEKALDDVFRSSESDILDMVEKMLDARVAENKAQGMKEMDMFDEEAALLDDIQDLIYFVRYKHPLVEESVPLATADPPKESSKVPFTVFLVDKNTEPRGDQGRKFTVNEGDAFAPEENKRPPENKEIKVHEIEVPEEDMDISEKDNLLDSGEIRDVNDSEDEPPVKESSPDQSVGEVLARGVISAEDTPLVTKQHPLDIISTEETPLDTEQHPLGMVSTEDTPLDTEQQLEANPEVPPILAAIKSAGLIVKENMKQYTKMLISSLPEDIQPGPDFHGIPWEPIFITAFLGIATFSLFFWRTFLTVKSRVYQVTEKQLAEKIKTLLQEKTEILEKIAEYDQKIKKAKESVKETKKQNSNLSDEAAGLKDKIRGLEETNQKMDDKVKNLHSLLEFEKEQNAKKQDMIMETQKSIEKLQEAITVHSVELSEVQIALNEAKLSEEKIKSELHHVQEENARLKKRKEQLLQEAEGWSERHTELSEQIKLYQKTQKDSEEALAYKENEIEVLTNCIMQLKQLDLDSKSEGKNNEEGNGWDDLANGELSDKITSDNRNEKMKSQIKQMMDVSRVKTTLTIVEEDRNRLQSKLSDETKARHELEEQIKKLEHDSSSLQSAKAQLENEYKTLQQKVEILSELYQQKEMALQKKLTQEEYERQEKEQKLTAADEKVSLVAEEVKTYKQRIQEMENELQKTERSYKNQIATHEKKAHDNWLIARAAERALAEEKREAANLRQKLTEVNQKIAMLQRPMIVKPTPGRPDHQIPPRRGPLSRDGSFGPSPVSGGAPSPPLMMELPMRSVSTALNRRDVPRSELGSMDGPPLGPGPRRSSEVSGRTSASDLGPGPVPLMNSGPRSSSPSTVLDGMVNTGPKGHPPFPGMPLMSPVGGPPPPPLRFGPPPPLRGPFGSRPLPPPLVPGGPPPPRFREYLHGLPPGVRDPPPDPREYIRGHPPFGPLGPPGPREYLPPGPRLPPPAHGPRDYPPPPFTRDLTPSGSRDYPSPHPPHASQGSTQDCAQAPEQNP
ncbi:transport and Golgi organization protein 1 homolog isoform X2 [Dromiciops gliroides]|uniref:transport and Golgi organization protein 1 homolog isoform X2 n=1 Tax=Dromiciops gliroides TaxID=33562 RepID=UPI001CC7414F|nr:transport and Golgi organization protein 1 homolog isoform X2 [Dromiciops gliroides]